MSNMPLDPLNFPYEYMDRFLCTAVGTYKRVCTPSVCCGSICQRPENPCIVDIDYCVEGNAKYEIVPELTVYSFDTTDGLDGTWHILQPITTDPAHSGQIFDVHGRRDLRFVADMCDHLSSFFSDPKFCFRITLKEYVDEDSVFGGFDDQLNPVSTLPTDAEPDDPFVAPAGGCRQIFYGPRLPRD